MGNFKLILGVIFLLTIANIGYSQLTINCPSDITVTLPPNPASMAVDWSAPSITSNCQITENICDNLPNMDDEFYSMGTYTNNHISKKIYYSKAKYTYNNAKAKAESYGGHLVKIGKKKKNRYIANHMKPWNAWIGLEETNGNWNWSTNSQSNFTNWAFNEPNNYGYWFWIEANNAVINKWNKKWYDQAESEYHYFIMEIPCETFQRPGDTAVSQTSGLSSGSLYEQGSYTVSYSVSDECGYSNTCSFTITVNPANPIAQLDPNTQPKFVNPLTIPSTMTPSYGNHYDVDMVQFIHDAGLIDPATGSPLSTKMWGYNGEFPGPTFDITANQSISVKWNNKLKQNGKVLPHILPVDETIHWARPTNYPNCGVPTVTHLHGGHTEASSDGYPDAWFTPDFQQTGNQFIKQEYTYANTQEPTLLWYHDHAVGLTRLNVYAGLAGAYILRNDWENNLNLPSGDYEIPLIISDKSFNEDGSLFYPSAPEAPNHPSPSILPEMYGDMILVNGKTWPVLEVEPRKYRFRLLNASDSRFYHFMFDNGMPFSIIGTDGGLIDHPNELTDLLVAPAERYDIIIDFSNPAYQNQTIILQNDANSPYPFGDPVDIPNAGQIMAFKVVKPLTGQDYSVVPQNLRSSFLPNPPAPVRTRQVTLNEGMDAIGRLKPILGTVEDGVLNWTAPITENPQINEPEIWEIINTTPDAHPIHLHQIFFQVLDHQAFDVNAFNATGTITRLGQPIVETKEFKDTYVVMPGEIARFAMTFDLEGLYVWHCHILSHEDYDMMRPLYVGDCNAPTNTPTPLEFMHCQPTVGSIGDFVWRDANGNGIQDNGEYGMANIFVKLLDCNNQVVQYTWTDNNGQYTFNDVLPGDYKVYVNCKWGFYTSPKNQGGNNQNDSDMNIWTNTTDCFSLSAGQDFTGIDAGLTPYFPWFRQEQILNLTLGTNRLVANLEWETNTSEFNDHFLVQRSNSGYDYETIATIENQNVGVYKYVDNHPKNGVNFYRIIAITTKGNEIHSNSLFGHFDSRDEINVFPNPASDYLMLNLTPYEGQSIDVSLINALGEVSMKTHIESVSEDLIRLDLDNQVGNGVYHLQIVGEDGESHIQKIIVNK